MTRHFTGGIAFANQTKQNSMYVVPAKMLVLERPTLVNTLNAPFYKKLAMLFYPMYIYIHKCLETVMTRDQLYYSNKSTYNSLVTSANWSHNQGHKLQILVYKYDPIYSLIMNRR